MLLALNPQAPEARDFLSADNHLAPKLRGNRYTPPALHPLLAREATSASSTTDCKRAKVSRASLSACSFAAREVIAPFSRSRLGFAEDFNKESIYAALPGVLNFRMWRMGGLN